MFRSAAVIVAAMKLVGASGWSDAELARTAAAIQAEAERIEADPLTFVSIAWHESSMRPGAVGDGGRAIGLGQIWYTFAAACAQDADPVGNPSPGCAAHRDALKDPVTNVRAIAGAIEKARQVCRSKTGSVLFHQWLALYGGLNHPRLTGIWCAQRRSKGNWQDVAWRRLPSFRGVREITDCRRSLIRKQHCVREGRARAERSGSTPRPRTRG